ncbi:hypothetical protein PAXRUDRAFT_830054 [Paxillus rubicundulus Ve08.2h10]|uniref:Unplaced genomic scaffold scaffold_469, whole genome shotgun sequence n=1 Tax=Paxillus rubicundulus Ve08.2h10 TaxID=930991 RepID=A0A0D0D697_9AGAM|nr:hypothetical protein PAXRUDRAFT_830054 [Paxillus rubicundulus Ve08.2h10]
MLERFANGWPRHLNPTSTDGACQQSFGSFVHEANGLPIVQLVLERMTLARYTYPAMTRVSDVKDNWKASSEFPRAPNRRLTVKGSLLVSQQNRTSKQVVVTVCIRTC